MQPSWSSDEDAIYRATHRAKDAFTEACSALYNDILNVTDFQQECCMAEKISHRQMELVYQGAQLSEVAPQYSDMVTHKLKALNRALGKANLAKQPSNTVDSKKSEELVAFSQLRKWILTTNEKLNFTEAKVARSSISLEELKRMYLEQQVFQKRIEKEGRSLTDNVRRLLKRNSQATAEDNSNLFNSPQQQRLKALTQRWHDIWLRSLAVICRVETCLGLQQEEENLEVSDDSREPPVKRRRTFGSSISAPFPNELQESEEDTIPFTEDDYERITEKPKMSQLRVECKTVPLTEDDAEHQPDIGYSSGENSISDSLSDRGKTTVEMSDNERRMRIESSPVKSYYKTVPLDDAGVTDTEIPRGTVSNIFLRKSGTDILTDSLVVNVEENIESHSDNDMEDVLALLDEEYGADAEKKYFQAQIECVKQGTRWREISSSQRSKRCSQGSLPIYKQNSCDASSEESEDEIRAESASCLTKSQCIPSNSLKRPYLSRSSNMSSLRIRASLLDMDSNAFSTSSCLCNLTASQSSEPSTSNAAVSPSLRLPTSHLHRTIWSLERPSMRRKLRTRRLPRSASDIERLNSLMSMSTHSAPGATEFFCNSFGDSEESAPEQSDAPPYEWDDYNPPAKVEDVGDLEKMNQTSVLSLDDDFQMQFGEDLKDYIIESRASLRSANALLNRQPTQQSLEDLRTMASAHAERLSALATNPRISIVNTSDFDEVSKGWKKLLATIDSLTTPVSLELSNSESFPIILSKVEKFALSLKCLQENECCKPSMYSISSIKSLDDVEYTLKVFGEIHERLVAEKEELQSLLHSDTFSGDLVELMEEFEPLSFQYEEAIEKVEQLMEQVEKVRQNWSDWTETQHNLQNIIVDIENELVAMRKGSNNCNQIASELELCQERMNRLETVCNYLTASLSELPENSSASKAIDFAAELTKYSTAVMQLKHRFEALRSLPISVTDKASSTHGENDLKQNFYDKTMFGATSEQQELQSPNWHLILLFCSAALAFFAWFVSSKSNVVNNWKNAPGLHLEYVNGPPPM